MSNCNCVICQFGKQLESSVMPEVEAQSERELVELALVQSQSNVNNANAVGVLTNAMQQLFDMGETSRANAVGRMLDELLPTKPDGVRPSNATDGEAGTASTQPADQTVFIPPEIEAMAKQLAEELGVEIKVFRFPTN